MIIESITCDVCGHNEPYTLMPTHEHTELELGGVPVNIWTPSYTFSQIFHIDNKKRGIARFNKLIPIPLDEKIVSYEGNTPLTEIEGAYLKDESNNPTGSFKDRGISALVSEAAFHGAKQIAIPSTGNAAISLGYYGNRAGIETIVFIPEGTPAEKISQISENSTIITDKDLIESYEHFFRFCKTNKQIHNGFPANSIAYIQGLKTISYEIYSQLGKKVPDHVIVPVGSGGNIVGIYYGFKDLFQMGLSSKIPRMISVQISGADPITQGSLKNQTTKLMVLDSIPTSKAEAIASDTCFNYFKILQLLSTTNGEAISVSEDEIDKVKNTSLEYSSRSVFPALDNIHVNDKGGKTVLIGTAGNKEG